MKCTSVPLQGVKANKPFINASSSTVWPLPTLINTPCGYMALMALAEINLCVAGVVGSAATT